jgi:hypothetical protein
LSQIYKNQIGSGPLPPNIPTSFVTDSGTVIPALNVVNINGGDTTANNILGIQVIANPNGSNNEVVQLTNRYTGAVTTTDGTTVKTLLSLPAGAIPGTYLFTYGVCGYNITDATGAAYYFTATVRTTGAALIVFGVNDIFVSEEGTMVGVSVLGGTSGNNYTVTVQGLAGKTIDWNIVGTYQFVS